MSRRLVAALLVLLPGLAAVLPACSPAPSAVPLADLYPLQGMIAPGQPARFRAELAAPPTRAARLQVQVTRLWETVESFAVQVPAGATAVEFSWAPPAGAETGYGVAAGGRQTALDVGSNWLSKPRYGFMTDFAPADAGQAQRLARLARYHLNGLQFYDWMYRHHRYLPPAAEFTDPLGRRLSLDVVREKINLAHAHGMAAMAYTAAYAAAPDFWQTHRDWGLYKLDGEPYRFGDDFLYIMDPSAGSPWRAHLLEQFRALLAELPFDGIHLDQYGSPRFGVAADGRQVDVGRALTEMVAEYRAALGRPLIFNQVANWPGRGDGDVVYIEVWPPYRYFENLRELVEQGRRRSGGRPVVLAAYIPARYEPSVRLTDAAIFASGGYHLELGENGALLADPYFPKYEQPAPELAEALRRYYDYAVRYQELLYAPDLVTAPWEAGVAVEGVNTANKGYYNLVWVVARENARHRVVHLINLLGLDSAEWNVPRTRGPTPLTDAVVRVPLPERPAGGYLLSPDTPDLSPRPLDFEYTDGVAVVQVPRLTYWTTLVFVEGA